MTGPRHLPFDGRPHRLRMGLRPLRPGEWLEPDERRAQQLALKRRLVAEHREQVIAVTPDDDGGVRAASEELLVSVRAELTARGLDELGIDPGADVDHAEVHPIEAVGLLTQEDWCVHLPDADGRWRLVAASVCFPTRWDLTQKIGRTVREIHAPVPGYDEQLGDAVDRFFGRLTPEAGVWRLNWNLLDDPALFQPVRDHRSGAVAVDEVGQRIWLRVERQALVRLPVSGATVFSIRVHQDPLDVLCAEVEAVERVRGTLRALPPDAVAEKGLVDSFDAILAWLDRAGSAGA